MSPNTLGNWIDGATLPPQTRIPSLAAALRISPRSLAKLINAERQQRRMTAEQRQDRDVVRSETEAVSVGGHDGTLSHRGHGISDHVGRVVGQS